MYKANNPPKAPTNVSPSDGAGNVSLNPTLKWTCSDPDGDSLTYDVYLSSDKDKLVKIKSGISDTSCATSNLKGNTPYYWQVVAFDGKGGKTASKVWSFTTLDNLIITQKWYLTTNETGNAGQTYSSPAITPDNNIFIGNTQGLFELVYDDAYYFSTTSPIWSSPSVDPVSNTVFVGNNAGQLLYSTTPFSTRGEINISSNPIVSALLIYKGNIYIIDSTGTIYKMSENSKSFSILKDKFSFRGNIWASPITNGTDIFIGSDNDIFYAINLENGKIDWQYNLGNPIYGTAAIGPEGNIYIGGIKLWSFTSSGALNWSKKLDGSRIYGSPVIYNNTVYIGTVKGDFYAVNSESGDILWQKDLSTSVGGISSSAIVADNNIIYISSGEKVYALNIESGDILSSVNLGYNIESSPLLHNGYIYVGCDDDYLYEIEALSSNVASDQWPMFMHDSYHSGLSQ